MLGTKIYTVHERGGIEGDVEFVREGFSFWAFLFSFVWLWFHRAWLAGTLVFAAFLLLGAFESVTGIPAYLDVTIQVVLAAGVGIFGNDLYRAALARRGYVEAGVASGGSVEEAELRYFGSRVAAIDARDGADLPIPA
ncbi:MAG: DUF2628 domain-containing protein [Alphaproteobacteria bacterium]|nr:DUF2628 domain-containing protein [Alphaproteobacteria bacterium]